MNDNIVLIGFMGSGKTTFGKWISRKYGYSFCDTDEYIEKIAREQLGLVMPDEIVFKINN